jgi:hypothetical protein
VASVGLVKGGTLTEIQRIDETSVEERSAATNAALGLAAFTAAEPYLKQGAKWAADKLGATQSEPPPQVELPPGVERPED